MVAAADTDWARERLIGFDLIRTWAFVAIVVYHCVWFFWPTLEGPPVPMETPFAHFIMDIYSRHFSFSGITLVFITGFLFGLKRQIFAGKWWLPFFLLGGWVAFSLILMLHDGGPFRMAWDVYPLLIVGTLSGMLLYRTESRRLLWSVFTLMAVALSVPFWLLEDQLPFSDYWIQVLVGQCPNAEWPVLPWVFLVWGGIALGRIYRFAREEYSPEKFMLTRAEWMACIAAVATLLYVSRRWIVVPGTPEFSCFTLRQPWANFWGYFVGLLALMRMSIDPRIQRWLKANPLTRSISALAFNRSFFVAYVGHYVALAVLTPCFVALGLFETAYGYDLGLAGILVLAELIPRTYRAIRANRL